MAKPRYEISEKGGNLVVRAYMPHDPKDRDYHTVTLSREDVMALRKGLRGLMPKQARGKWRKQQAAKISGCSGEEEDMKGVGAWSARAPLEVMRMGSWPSGTNITPPDPFGTLDPAFMNSRLSRSAARLDRSARSVMPLKATKTALGSWPSGTNITPPDPYGTIDPAFSNSRLSRSAARMDRASRSVFPFKPSKTALG